MCSNLGELERLRGQIDAVDAELLERFVARLELAAQIGAHKRALGLAIRDPVREHAVVDAALEQTCGRCPPALVEGLVTQLIDAARLVQSRPRVAYLGPATTHSHRAVRQCFADPIEHPCASLTDAVAAVRTGAAEYAVVPWANRHAGPVVEVQAVVTAAGLELRILGRTELAVGHTLAAQPNTELGAIDRVFCRPEPLAGARSWFERELPSVTFERVASNDEAARQAASTPRSAAITTTAAADAWALERLVDAIDGDDNRTTFVILAGAELPRLARSSK